MDAERLRTLRDETVDARKRATELRVLARKQVEIARLMRAEIVEGRIVGAHHRARRAAGLD
jgi:hypothetical protein